MIECINERLGFYQVENFPSYAICYCMYGDTSGLDDQDIKTIDDFLKEHNLGSLMEVVDGSYNGFCSHPVFGLGIDTYTVIFSRG